MQIDIIGAGIGGLTTAIALEQKGIEVRLFEQAKSIKPMGAGIILASNAMQVFDRLGLREAIEENGHHISSMNITKADLSVLSKMDFTFFENKHNVKSIAIHRGVLQELLVSKLESTKIHLGHKLSSLKEHTTGCTLEFDNGEQIKSATVIGADGLNSVVRKAVFPQARIRNANQMCWRGICDYNLPETYKHELNEAWGGTERFGFVQIAKNKVYWYALKSAKTKSDNYSLENIDTYFENFNPLVRDIIRSTIKEKIHTAEISDLRPNSSWYESDVCLIGDAAHAATPNMGQGACQAIEDGYILTECLAKYDTQKAFEEFLRLRMPKAHHVVNTSWRIGKMAHFSNPLLVGLRNRVLKSTPASITRNQNERIFELAQI